MRNPMHVQRTVGDNETTGHIGIDNWQTRPIINFLLSLSPVQLKHAIYAFQHNIIIGAIQNGLMF